MRRSLGTTVIVAAVVLGVGGRTGGELAPGSRPSASNSAAPAIATPATTTPTPATTWSPRVFTVVSSGDILLHERLWNQAKRDASGGRMDFAPQFADVAPLFQHADLALCHLETPLAPVGGPYKGYPVFSSPPQIVKAIVTAGFDMCGTASNHSFDQGSAGIKRTLDDLDAAGIPHTGSARSAAEARQPLVLTVATPSGPVKVGIIAFTYGFNGIGYPQGHTWAANLIDVPAIVRAARACRAAGAEVVIAKLHWGTEYTSQPNAFQHKIARRLAASGQIDLIDGDHTHSVQPIEKVGSMWVIYSHGNLIAAHREPTTIKSEGVISRWTFTEGSDHRFTITKVEVAPTLITDRFPVRVLDISRDLASGQWQGTTGARLREAQRRTLATINSMGAHATLIR